MTTDKQLIEDWREATFAITKAAMEGLLAKVPESTLRDNPELYKSAFHAASEIAGVVMANPIIKPKVR